MAGCAFDRPLLSNVLPPLLLLECVLGMLGNGGALWIFCFHVKPWKSSTVFLFNLALADFLLIVILPFRAVYYLRELDWIFGDAFCRISLFMLAMNRGGSIFFLTAVAVDRYLRVVHPHHPINSMAVSRGACVAIFVWVLNISLTARLLTESHQNSTHCESFGGSSDWYHSVFLLEFAIPLVIILFCTARVMAQLCQKRLSKDARIRRALWCLSAVMVTFVVCFLPSNAALLLIWAKTLGGGAGCDKPVSTAFFIAISLTYLNSTLDPVVYYFSSPAFKRIYRKATRPSLWGKEAPAATVDMDGTRDSKV
ncbi:hydroxycarboxylic acid receptor 2-like [Conger conger]|uniref:hydroxycarboxylic acid receptor 2-like n=1 Tax=Conger conger TaxID=82655 RepID=UPI002A5AE576|nr:hydroxycarboxylic acid receptor 2-like [Conger conger]